MVVRRRSKAVRKSLLRRLFLHPVGKSFIALSVFFGTLGILTFSYYYSSFSRLIDAKLEGGPFTNTSMIFAAPRTVSVNDETSPDEVARHLRRSGYMESRNARIGWYRLRPDAIDVYPGEDSYFDQEGGTIEFADGVVSRIVSLRDSRERQLYLLEPELVTNLSNRNREKRRLVRFADIPATLVNAIVSAEDKRFFQHSGFDPLRIVKAAYVDLKEGSMGQGASTLSMQLARDLWLDREKTWRRKAAEVLVTLHLEQKLSKQDIFEYYVNQSYLGRRGSFNIHGFGEGAEAFFGKDIQELTLPEAALLAGLIQRPSYANPFRHPERAVRRRNLVLLMMRENGYITDEQLDRAREAPLDLAPPTEIESTDAPYFVDLVNRQLQDTFADRDFQASSYRIYTSLDLDLQREAAEAVRMGMQEVDKLLEGRRRRDKTLPEPQVALVALDPRTGQIKALIGGRSYGTSQLNRALAKRQPGSAFKPFVYAAALNSALGGSTQVFTPASTVLDEPTTFWFNEQPYEPANYKDEFNGLVTLREAFQRSLNVPTVKVAEMVGYEKVVDVATRAGMNLNILPTPAVALGAYEVTPVEVAGSYTVFVDQGFFVRPNWINLIRDQDGKAIYRHSPTAEQALDPRVAYLMVNMMEGVIRNGTGIGVRLRGLTVPAAGKTGTSHDGWFAGFTSKLICAVWVGFDDNRELNLEGAHTALPVWTEFMKRAHQYPEYRDVAPFEVPDGIVSVEVDPTTGLLATPACPERLTEIFIAGTQPLEVCRLHGRGRGGGTQVAGWATPSSEAPMVASASAPTAPKKQRGPGTADAKPNQASSDVSDPASTEKPKGLFRRILGIFR